MSSTTTTDESRVRRTAAHEGLRLRKLRRSMNPNESAYQLSDPASNTLVTGGQFGIALDEVEMFLRDRVA